LRLPPPSGRDANRAGRPVPGECSVEHELEQARVGFRQALIEAHEAGVSYGMLGRTVGLSRERVAEIVAGG